MFGYNQPRVRLWSRVTILPRVTMLVAELLEDTSCQDPVNDGVTFYVRYLGCCGVPRWEYCRVSAILVQKLQILCNPPCLQAERRGGDSWGHQEHHSGGKLYFAPASDKIQYASQWYTCLFISVQETIFLHFSLFCLYPCLDYFPLSAHRTKNIFTKHSQTSQTRNLLLLQNWTFTSFVRLRKREWNHKDYNLRFYFKTIMWSGF